MVGRDIRRDLPNDCRHQNRCYRARRTGGSANPCKAEKKCTGRRYRRTLSIVPGNASKYRDWRHRCR